MWYAILGVVVIGYGSLMIWFARRRARIKDARKNVTLGSFLDEFKNEPYAHAAVEAAYVDLTAICRHPVLKADNLKSTLGLLPEDFDDALEKRCKDLGVSDVWKSPYAKLFPLNTVEDYVRFLSEVMNGEAKKSATS